LLPLLMAITLIVAKRERSWAVQGFPRPILKLRLQNKS
jgi:hypothetical protein